MRITKALAALVLVFTLTGYCVSGYIPENSRQGSDPVSVTSRLVIDQREAAPLQGLGLVLLELAADSLFLTKDPIGFRGGRNLWIYARNNPVNLVDPLGLSPIYPTQTDIELARDQLRAASSLFLTMKGPEYKFAVDLFQYSLQDYPALRFFNQDAYATQIKNSNALSAKFDEFVLPFSPGSHEVNQEGLVISFDSELPLFYAIHIGTLDFKGTLCKTSNAQYSLDLKYVILGDTYDFADLGPAALISGLPGFFAQSAYLYQQEGVVVPYKWYANTGHFTLSK